MGICKISAAQNLRNRYSYNYCFAPNITIISFGAKKNNINQVSQDCFVKTDNNIKPEKQVFGTDFPRTFFQKLIQEGVPCAYTGKPMIARKEYERIKNSHVLEGNSFDAVRILKPYENVMYDVEHEIFSILEFESETFPKSTLQELLQRKKNSAQKVLALNQINVLNKINKFAVKHLKDEDFYNYLLLYSKALEEIHEPGPNNENWFKRKAFINDLINLKLKDKDAQEKIIEYAQDLPQSSTSSYAFIVKYSQPYKYKYNHGFITKYPRDNQEIGLRLLKPSIATDEHIHPQTMYKAEEKARKKGELWAQNLSDYKVTILTSDYINGVKSNKPFDEFVKECPYDVSKNVQKHINRLITICAKWAKAGKIEDAHKLSEYILVLKKEFKIRSELVNPNISELYKILPEIEQKYKEHIELINMYKSDKNYEVLKNLKK